MGRLQITLQCRLNRILLLCSVTAGFNGRTDGCRLDDSQHFLGDPVIHWKSSERDTLFFSAVQLTSAAGISQKSVAMASVCHQQLPAALTAPQDACQ